MNLRLLLPLVCAASLAAQGPGLDLGALRSRAQRFAGLAPEARAEVLGQELAYAGLHPEPLPGGHFIIRFPGPHLGEDPDVLAVPLDWAPGDASGARAAAALVELANALKLRHYRPKHVLWLLWAHHGPEGLEALIQSQEHQNKLLAHVVLMEGGWEGLATASEGSLAVNLAFDGNAPAPEAFSASLGTPPQATAKVDPAGPAGLSVELRSADLSTFRSLEPLVRTAGLKAGAKAFTLRFNVPPAPLQGGATHPLAALVADETRRTLGAAPAAAPPQAGRLALLLARGVPSVALGLGVFEGGRPAELMDAVVEAMQDLP
jgi:hypothetical protein